MKDKFRRLANLGHVLGVCVALDPKTGIRGNSPENTIITRREVVLSTPFSRKSHRICTNNLFRLVIDLVMGQRFRAYSGFWRGCYTNPIYGAPCKGNSSWGKARFRIPRRRIRTNAPRTMPWSIMGIEQNPWAESKPGRCAGIRESAPRVAPAR